MARDRARAAEILAIERECVAHECNHDCGICSLTENKYELMRAYETAIAVLKGPEIIYCGECGNWDKESGLSARWCGVHGITTKRTDYCSYAERRKEDV